MAQLQSVKFIDRLGGIPGKNTCHKGLTPKQKRFCEEYIYDWNATRSYLNAYPNTKNAKVAGVLAVRMLANDRVKAYITEIQEDLEKTAGQTIELSDIHDIT